ncbi:tyrosine-type recombinase/integrase [Bythopirellula polymerisocia]|uniref:Site-specific tyrosine recombinase XerC n=1 Tax=Bythopirellula polymerisocia TaxID=2528003 RepID=A0A5C6CX48_9BACT|nr:tyrosine-type recombinase/integrase [Bythopirellula polymerisocia]TWU27596.1 site-specific tyrosine recombinase XerC [Bythopirellula polymerisocia]
MASIIRDRNRKTGQYNGCRSLQFIAPDGKRKSVRLGKVSAKGAETIKVHVESMLADLFAQKSWDPETAVFIGKLDSKLYKKLAGVGLLPKREKTEAFTLGPFLDAFIASQSLKVKPATVVIYNHTRRCLVDYFGAGKILSEITPGDADDWRTWLGKHEGLAPNTTRRRCGLARQYFRAALRKRLITENPFAEMREGVSCLKNEERQHFIPRDVADTILDSCPNSEWKLIFALSRYGGLRCPSEHLALTWGDINWEYSRITVRSSKTAHHEGKGSRVIPLFSELRPILEAVLNELLEDFDPKKQRLSEQPVITRYRDRGCNLRTQMLRIIKRAGVDPWPKLFHNLRASRATELAAEFPAHVAAAWLGHSTLVAQKHYWQVTDADFAKAVEKCMHKAQQKPAVTGGNESEGEPAEPIETAENPVLGCLPVGDTRLELVTSTV